MFISRQDGVSEADQVRQVAQIAALVQEGDRLANRYKIVRCCGSGGFSAVFQATDEFLHRDVALKVMSARDACGEPRLPQLQREFALRERITDFLHVMTVQDPRPASHKDVEVILIPMPLADGGNLYDWLRRLRHGQTRIREIIAVFLQICAGLQAIHDAGLIHGDITPGNVLFGEGKVKIADLGLCRYVGGEAGSGPERTHSSSLGTLAYMAPEKFFAARQKDISEASDVYSICVMLYEALDGEPPFDGDFDDLKHKHQAVAPTRIQGISDALWGVIQRGLEKDPSDRFGSVDELIAAIEEAHSVEEHKRSVAKPPVASIEERTPDEVASTLFQSVQSLTHAAECTIRESGDSSLARAFLYRAEFCAWSIDDILLIAGYWQRLLDDAEERDRCLVACEDLASSCPEWLSLGRAYGDPQNSRRCREQALSAARTSTDWCCLAYHGNHRERLSRIERGESKAKTTMEWISCAHFWFTSTRQSPKAERVLNRRLRHCLKQAERCAATPGDWQACGRSWQSYGYPRKVIRCIKKGTPHPTQAAERQRYIQHAKKGIIW